VGRKARDFQGIRLLPTGMDPRSVAGRSSCHRIVLPAIEWVGMRDKWTVGGERAHQSRTKITWEGKAGDELGDDR
jgi:hypothetical protein